MRFGALLLASLFAATFGCAASSADRYTVETIALGAPLDSAVGLEAPEVAIEIADGVVVLPDPSLPGVLRLDLPSGTRDSVGHAGDGPGEFRSPFFVQAVGRGSLVVLDGLARRATVLDTALTFRAQYAPETELAPFSLRFDTLGNAFSVAMAIGSATAGDSLPILRRRHDAVRLDTVTFVQRLVLHPLQFGSAMMMVPAEYAPRDLWGVRADGTVWVGRGERSVLEFIALDGTRTEQPLAFEPIRTVAGDLVLFRGLPAPPEMAESARPLAPAKGPFQEIRAAPDGHLFLWLNQPFGYATERVAELDARGQLLRILTLPLGSKLVLAGESYLYTTAEDRVDGTWVLRRHARPK